MIWLDNGYNSRTRGFEIVSEFIDKEINIPQRNTKSSAGYDLEAAEDVLIFSGETVLIPTGLKAYMQSDEVLQVYVRSSIGVKKGLRLANQVGIIDSDYYNNYGNEGLIFIPLYNSTLNPVSIKKGERIAQGIFINYLLADNDNAEGERIGGFGSTGK
jgi:dUTP pyrophosphatase